MPALATLTLLAALVFGPEFRQGPYPSWSEAGHPAVASSQSGMLMVWSEIGGGARIRAQRLDRSGRPVGEAQTLSSNTGADAMAPAVASNGEDYLVAWQELDPASPIPHIVIVSVDASGTVTAVGRVRRSVADPRFQLRNRALNVVWFQGEYLIYAQDHRWRVAGGTLIPVPAVLATPDRATSNGTGALVTAEWQFRPQQTFCSGLSVPINCTTIPEQSTLVWTVTGASGTSRSGSDPRLSTRGGKPAVATSGSDSLVVWHLGTTVVAYRIDVEGKLVEQRVLAAVDAPPLHDASPGVAWDGRRYLVVWRSATAIHAVTLDETGWSEPFVIPASGADRRVDVVTAAPNRFLLLWSELVPQGSHAWRTIDFSTPSRRRSIR